MSTQTSVVLGQAGMTAGQCRQGAAHPTAASLCVPHGTTATQDALWVNDHTHNRMLIFAEQ